MREEGAIAMLDRLLRRGVEVNQYGYLPMMMRGGTALHYAAYLGSTHEVRWLLDHGADSMYRADDSTLPVGYAVFRDHHGLSQMLIEEHNKFIRARRENAP